MVDIIRLATGSNPFVTKNGSNLARVTEVQGAIKEREQRSKDFGGTCEYYRRCCSHFIKDQTKEFHLFKGCRGLNDAVENTQQAVESRAPQRSRRYEMVCRNSAPMKDWSFRILGVVTTRRITLHHEQSFLDEGRTEAARNRKDFAKYIQSVTILLKT